MPRRLTALALWTLTMLSLPFSSAHAAKIWYEYGIASATGGYDAPGNRTLINKYYVAAFGPDDVGTELRNYVRACVKQATISAVHTFQQTPGEVGVRISAAYGSFHGGLSACLSVRNAAKAYIDKFEIGYIRCGYWEPGLNLKFTAESPSTQIYVKLHNAVKGKLPDPVNKLIVFYINSQQPPRIDIKLNPPKEETHFLAQLPDPTELRRFSERADMEARRRGQRIADDVRQEAENASRRLGSDAASVGRRVLIAPVTVVGEAARGAQQVAPKVLEAVSPIQHSGSGTAAWPLGPLGPVVKVDGNNVVIQPFPGGPSITVLKSLHRELPEWEVSATTRSFRRGKIARFHEDFAALRLEKVEASEVTKGHRHLLQVKIAGIDPQCALGIDGTPNRASLWADVTDTVNQVRVKLMEFSQGKSGNDPVPRIVWSEGEIPSHPTALRLVLHGNCLLMQ